MIKILLFSLFVDDYVPPVFSRSQSRDSGTPRILSRRSSIESPLSLSRQMSLDENDDTYRSGKSIVMYVDFDWIMLKIYGGINISLID